MRLQTGKYLIESGENLGFRLTVTVPSEHVKSKAGFTSKTTFHASLHQVAEKMAWYSLEQSDVNDVVGLASALTAEVDRLAFELGNAQFNVNGDAR